MCVMGWGPPPPEMRKVFERDELGLDLGSEPGLDGVG